MREESESRRLPEGLLDVSKVITGETASIDFDNTVEVDFSDDDTIADKDVRVSGKFTDNSGYMHLDIKIEASYKTSCARCLKEIDAEFVTEQSLPITTEPEEGEDTESEEYLETDYFFVKKGVSGAKVGYSIDLGEICYMLIITSLPTRHLCSQDCRGLCPKCGADLNEGECGCDRRPKDPRLAGLEDFFK